MPERTIAIGDIHGCSAAFRSLIQAISPQPQDTLVTLGDYVDRGPDSRGVLDLLLKVEKTCRLVPLLGNHELMVLDVLQHPEAEEPWKQCGGLPTLRSYGGSLKKMPPEHLAFIRRCKRYYETATHFFVHANYDAHVPLDEQPDNLLFWEHLHFSPPAPHDNGKTAIVGHTSQIVGEVCDLGHVVGIDTFCHGGGWLTAMDVATGQLWQADLKGRLRRA